MVKVAAIQMCSSNNMEENLASAQQYIGQAAQEGAQLVVLPEMFALISERPGDKVQAKEETGKGKIQDFLSEQARMNKIWLIGGTIPLTATDPRKVRAACLVFDDKGVQKARYDKIHLFDVTLSEQEKYCESNTVEGGDTVVLVTTPFGTLGLAVCYDIRFPALFSRLTQEGAEIIILPAAFTFPTGQAHWEILARSTAIQNFCYFIGACQGGQHHAKRRTWGHSLVVSPWGKIIAEKPDQETGIIYAQINLDEVKEARQAIPALLHGKIARNFKIINCR